MDFVNMHMKKSFLIRTLTAAAAMTMMMATTVLANPVGEDGFGEDEAMYTVNAGDPSLADRTVSRMGSYSIAGVSVYLDEYYHVVDEGNSSLSIEVELKSMLDEDVAVKASVLDDYDNLGIAVVDNYLNIRDFPSTDSSLSKVIGKMTNHTACEILDHSNGWYYIKSGAVTGYVSEEYIVTGDEAITLAVEESKLRAIVQTESTSLNVRKEPSTDSAIIDKVSSEERYEVLEVLDNWVKIETVDGDEGYVSSDYVIVKYALNEAVEYSPDTTTTSLRQQVVDYAMQFLGNRYVWGGTSLTKGCDCSGFTMQIMAHFGVRLSHYSKAQANEGRTISYSQIQPGDLIFYGSSGVSGIGHVALYIGNGKIIHAASTKSGIIISNANYKTILKVVNVLD